MTTNTTVDRENNELKEIFDRLKEEHNIEEMIGFSEIDIAEKLQKNDFLIVKYKELYYKELQVLEILEGKMDALKGIRFKHYRFNDNYEYKTNEIEKYCFPSDKKIIQMKKIITKQQVRVRFFEMCYKSLEKQSWSMKTYTDRERMGL